MAEHRVTSRYSVVTNTVTTSCRTITIKLSGVRRERTKSSRWNVNTHPALFVPSGVRSNDLFEETPAYGIYSTLDLLAVVCPALRAYP